MADSLVNNEASNGGGYDCELIELPPTAFQTVCPICHLFLREPHLISCCGQKICRQCLELDKPAGRGPCRLCGESQFTTMQDRGLERSMKELEVRCTYKKEGCAWAGKLGELEIHHNKNGVKSENECLFVKVGCRYNCGEWPQRRNVDIHESVQCSKRPYTCDHCHSYQSTFEDVEKHYLQCSMFPTACPNHCREELFERQQIDTHLQDECPLVLVNCPYKYAGCKVELVRKNVHEHIEKQTSLHLTLLGGVTENLMKTNRELKSGMNLVHELNVKQVSMMTECGTRDQELEQTFSKALQQLNQQVVQLTATASVLTQENRELRQTMEEKEQKHSELVGKLAEAEKGITDLRKEMREIRLETTQRFDYPKEFSLKATSVNLYTPAFFTHPHGYRLCLRVCPKGVSGNENHVGIYVYLMRGPFDKHLHWPFMGEITVQVVNLAGDHDHVEKTICFNEETPETHSRRVKVREMSDSGWGKRYFVAHENLRYNALKETQYLKNHQLVVRIAKISVF